MLWDAVPLPSLVAWAAVFGSLLAVSSRRRR